MSLRSSSWSLSCTSALRPESASLTKSRSTINTKSPCWLVVSVNFKREFTWKTRNIYPLSDWCLTFVKFYLPRERFAFWEEDHQNPEPTTLQVVLNGYSRSSHSNSLVMISYRKVHRCEFEVDESLLHDEWLPIHIIFTMNTANVYLNVSLILTTRNKRVFLRLSIFCSSLDFDFLHLKIHRGRCDCIFPCLKASAVVAISSRVSTAEWYSYTKRSAATWDRKGCGVLYLSSSWYILSESYL